MPGSAISVAATSTIAAASAAPAATPPAGSSRVATMPKPRMQTARRAKPAAMVQPTASAARPLAASHTGRYGVRMPLTP